jgi:CMP-2-keto-3-deoxyoctulosonic acid synthetase
VWWKNAQRNHIGITSFGLLMIYAAHALSGVMGPERVKSWQSFQGSSMHFSWSTLFFFHEVWWKNALRSHIGITCFGLLMIYAAHALSGVMGLERVKSWQSFQGSSMHLSWS